MNKRILSLFLAIVMVFGVVSPAFAAGFTPQNHLQKATESELIADKGKLKAKLSLPKTEKRPVKFMAMAMAKSGAEPGFGETKVTVNIAKHGIGSNDFAFDKVFGSGAAKKITLHNDSDESSQEKTFTKNDASITFDTPVSMKDVKAGDVFIEFEGTHVAGKLTWEESDPSYSGGTNVTTYKLDLYQVRNTDVVVTTKTTDGTEATNPTTSATNGKIKLGSLNKKIDIPVKGTTGVFTGKNIRVKDVDTLNADPNYSIEGTESGVLVDKTNKKVYKPGKFVVDEEGIKPTEVTFTEKPIVTDTEPKIDDPENPGTQITDPDYVAVTFNQGDHGTIATNKTYYVFKGVTMDSTLTPPKVTADEGYQFTGWKPVLAKKYDENTTHKAKYTKDTCLTPLALKEQFENAANEKFASVGSKDGVYIGHFDEAKKEVTVYIIDKTQVAKEISGTGLAAGLADLYENHNLVKVKVGDQDERDLIDIANKLQAGGMNIMQTFKTIFGADILNAVQTEGNKTGTLADFIDKSVVLKLTIEQAGCGNAVTVEYKVNGKEAASSLLKDKLDPQDISVWVGDEFKWKDGIKLKEADEDLQAILDKATVTDLGENGTEKDPKTPRTSAAKGKFPGNLLVTFEDGSKLVVENQNLYVYANGDEKPEDGKPLPTDSATVTFTKDDNSIKADGWETVKPIIVKKGTKVPDGKFPNAEAKDGYHTVAWTPAKTTVITEDQTFNASATKNVPTTSNAEDYDPHYTDKSGKPGETVQIAPPTFTKIGVTGNVPAPSDGAKKTTFTKNDNTQTNVTVDTNTGAITVVIPQDATVGSTITIPVDVTYPDDSNETVEVTVTVGEDKTKVEYPNTEIEKGKTKTVTPKVTDNDGKPVTGDKVGTPTVTNTNELPNGVTVTPKENGKVDITVPDDYDGPKDITIKVTVPVDDKNVDSEIKVTVKDKTTPPTPQGPSVTYPDTSIDKGDTKTVTPDIKDKDGKTTTPESTPEVSQPGHGLIVTPNKDGSIDVTVPKDYDGPGTITVDVTVRVDGKDINTTLTIKVNSGEDDSHRPEQGGGDIFDGLFKRHDYTPTYPVKTVVPEKTKEINKLWYIFHIDEYDYEEVRNYNSKSHKMDVTPVIRNERTMLPLRYVAEAINADVIWNAETRTATFTKDGLTASIQIDSDEIVLSNGKTVKMDSKPLNINDRILVSVVNVANVFGLTNGNTLDGVNQDIEWDHDTRTATIYIRR